MSNKGNKYKVGLLAIVSAILLIIVLFSLGILSSFKAKYRFMTIVTTSVQGLEKGAPVKFKGVTIGKVDDIQIAVDGGFILIYMEMNPQAIAEQISTAKDTDEGKDPDEKFEIFLKDRVKQGARCQLRYGGITGNLYVEIGLYDPKKFPLVEHTLPEGHPPYLPSVPPVLIENIMGNLQEALEQIADVDINKMVKNIDDTINNVNVTLNEINKGIKDAKISALSDSMRGFLKTSEKTMMEVSQLRKSIETSLQNADDIMSSAKNLIEYLEEHPSSIIHGRSDKPVVEP